MNLNGHKWSGKQLKKEGNKVEKRKESFRYMLSQRTPEAVKGYRRARRAAAATVAEAAGVGGVW